MCRFSGCYNNFVTQRPRDIPHRHHGLGTVLVIIALVVACLIPPTSEFWVNELSQFASVPLNTAFLTTGIFGLLYLAWRNRSRADALRVVYVMLTETALVHLLKVASSLVRELNLTEGVFLPRPNGTSGGFPSGHAAASCALAFLLTERMPRLAPVWYGLAALISWSRVEARAHFPYQVVGGAILGLTVAIVVTQFLRKRAAQRQRSENLAVEDEPPRFPKAETGV